MSGALVLDSEGLAKAVQRDREIHEWLTAARDADLPATTSAAVLVEVIHPKINDAALKWTLSRLTVEPVTQAVAQSAAALLSAAGFHGHKYAIDAILCATALHHPGRVTILTSDVEDIELLTAEHPRVSAGTHTAPSPHSKKAQVSDLGLNCGAGDENRTRTLSLGS